MSDKPKQQCVCGHPASSHWHEEQQCLMDWQESAPMNRCQCERFREVVDWPDAECWWWMEHTTPANECHPDIKTGGLLYAEHECEDDTPIVIDDDDHPMETRDEWWARGGVTRFTRAEPNPFTAGQ